MDSYTYPGLSCQKQFHADLIDKFAKEANDFERHSTTLSIAALFLIEGTVNVHYIIEGVIFVHFIKK